MTPPLDLDALAREACGCFICRSDSGLTVNGTTERWRNARDEIIAAGKRMELKNFTSCNCPRILSALRKVEEQAKAAERERCAQIFDRRAEAVGHRFTLAENILMAESPDRERAAAIRRGVE